MDYLTQRIDTDLAWFIIAVLVLLLLTVFVSVLRLYIQLQKMRQAAKMIKDKCFTDWMRPSEELAIPTYLRLERLAAKKQEAKQ